jgi:hypothetical protein
MSRASTPASPADDLHRPRPTGAPVVPDDLAAFLSGGYSVAVAARGLDGRPLAGVALACVPAGPGRLRVVMRAKANAALLTAVEAGSALAVTVSRPLDHRSIQVKAAAARRVATTPGDLAATAAQAEGFRCELVLIGYPPAFAAAYVAHEPADLAAVEMEPDAVFVQTPGPGAGSALA